MHGQVTGVDEGPLPSVAVRGVGKLVFPIDAEQGEDLAFAGMPAPYGKGPRTELDPAVRKATQLDPGRVRFSADWDGTLRRITAGASHSDTHISSNPGPQRQVMPHSISCICSMPLAHARGYI